jgi:ribosome maturation factor RimP
VTIDECVAVSRKLSETLDDPATELSAGYILEVSSPGLDHRLATEKEFRRFHGRLAKIKWPVDGKLMVLKGRLATADGPLRLITPTGEITFEANADLKAALIPEI